MIKCLMDVTVPENSKCAKCCIYCDEKETCECVCPFVANHTTEDEILNKCSEREWVE